MPELVVSGDPYGGYPKGLAIRWYGFGAIGLVAVVTLAFFFVFAERPGAVRASSLLEFDTRGASRGGTSPVQSGPRVRSGSPSGASSRSGGATWSEASGVGRLYVLTYPPGAAVWVDGDSVGVTPVPPHALRAGAHALSIRKEGFAPYDTVVWLASDETSFHHVELEAGAARSRKPAQASPAQRERGAEEASGRGGIAVSSDPAGSEVWIDDERAGTTPLTLSGLTRGWHRLSIRHDGYEPHVAEVEVEPGAVADLQVALAESTGALTVLVRPWGSIYIDGRLHKLDTDAPYRTALAVGTHRIKALHPTLGTLEREVVVEAGGAQRVVLDLSSDGEGVARPVVVPRDRAGSPPPDRVPPPPEVFDVAEVPPVLLGGLEGLHRQARYPERAYAFGVEGQVFLQFVVGADGRVREPRVVRGLGMGCDEEALRVIREARFTPGTVGGEPVAVRHALSIRFKRGEP